MDAWTTQQLARERQRNADHAHAEARFWRVQLPVAEMAAPMVYAVSQMTHPEGAALHALQRFNQSRDRLTRRIQTELKAGRSPRTHGLSPYETSRRFSQLKQLQLSVSQAKPATQLKPLSQGLSPAVQQALGQYQRAQNQLGRTKPGLQRLLHDTPWLHNLLGLQANSPVLASLAQQPNRFLQQFYQRAVLQQVPAAFFTRMLTDLQQAGHLRSLVLAGSATLGLLGLFETQRELTHARIGRTS